MGFTSKSHFSFHVLYLFGCTVDFFILFFYTAYRMESTGVVTCVLFS